METFREVAESQKSTEENKEASAAAGLLEKLSVEEKEAKDKVEEKDVKAKEETETKEDTKKVDDSEKKDGEPAST